MNTDIVVYNGLIRLPDGSVVSALAARDGRIVVLGSDEAARSVPLGRGAEKIDLKGACVIPGLWDSHMHFSETALGLGQVNVELPSQDDALSLVARRAATLEPGDWLLGFGWNHHDWGGAFPNAAALDRAAPRNPVCLQAKSGHALWLNSRALAGVGIGHGTPDPSDGKLLRDSGGELTGILLDGAMNLARARLPKPGIEELASAMIEASAAAHRLGLVGVHDMDGPESFAAEQLLRSRDLLTLSVVKSIPLERLDEALSLGLRSGFGDQRLRVGHVKIFADGAMGPRTAWMLEGYQDAPEDRGISVTPPRLIREAIVKANSGGLACAIHAIGDRANREVLDAYEWARGELAARGRVHAAPAAPNRIEHAQILSHVDLGRLAALGLAAAMQPGHATAEIGYTDLHLGRRSAGAYAFKSILDTGAVLAFGSDCPVDSLAPLAGIQAAVTRRDASGQPGPEGWHGGERLSVAEAVKAYSWGAARAGGLDRERGGLELGKIADFVILERDIYSVDPMGIQDIRIMATIAGGNFVWRSPEL